MILMANRVLIIPDVSPELPERFSETGIEKFANVAHGSDLSEIHDLQRSDILGFFIQYVT